MPTPKTQRIFALRLLLRHDVLGGSVVMLDHRSTPSITECSIASAWHHMSASPALFTQVSSDDLASLIEVQK